MTFHIQQKYLAAGEDPHVLTVIGVDDAYGNIYMKRDDSGLTIRVEKRRLEGMVKRTIMTLLNPKHKEA